MTVRKNKSGRVDDPAGLPAGLPAPARRALIAAGYTRVDQLSAAREEELLRLHGMGPKALETIRATLREAGLGPSGRSP